MKQTDPFYPDQYYHLFNHAVGRVNYLSQRRKGKYPLKNLGDLARAFYFGSGVTISMMISDANGLRATAFRACHRAASAPMMSRSCAERAAGAELNH